MIRLSMLAALLLAAGLAGYASASSRAQDKAYASGTASPKATSPQTDNLKTAMMLRVGEAQARSIAFGHGLVHIEEIALAGWRWELAGRDRSGDELVIDISAKDGSLLP